MDTEKPLIYFKFAWEGIKRWVRGILSTLKRYFARLIPFFKKFQVEYAKAKLKSKDRADRTRAAIFLKTKNRRIKRKQWRLLFPARTL